MGAEGEEKVGAGVTARLLAEVTLCIQLRKYINRRRGER